MKRVRLTMSQALVKFLDNQYIECDGVETKFVSGMFGIFGHGCVVGVGAGSVPPVFSKVTLIVPFACTSLNVKLETSP